MADSGLYPNDGDTMGTYYQPEIPEEQLEAEEEDRKLRNAANPILDHLIEWFQDQIDAADSTDNIELDTLEVNGVKYERKTSIEAQILAYRLLKQMLSEKQGEFKAWSESLK